MIRLYHSPLSPFCRKVRLALAEKKIEVDLVEERYWEAQPEFLRRNPAGKVPVLRIDGTHLADSQAICEFLEETVPTPPLMPRDALSRAEVRRLCGWFDDKFHQEVTAKLLYEKVIPQTLGRRSPDSRNVTEGSRALRAHLDYISHLLDHRRWLAGDVMTLADFAAAAHLSSLDYIDVMSEAVWAEYPSVKQWYATIKSRPSFRSLLADRVSRFEPPRHYTDLDF